VRHLRLLGYNVLVFFVVANVLYWSIPLISAGLRGTGGRAGVDPRSWAFAALPNYAAGDAEWAQLHSDDLKRRTSVYRSLVAWQTAPLTTRTINVEGPYLQRRTRNVGASGTKRVYFFGGSTMWGIGADEPGTIPSQFAALTAIHSENFAEVGWTAQQGLIRLIQLLQDGHRPDLVVFYDGVNDALHKCRIELGIHAHEREQQFDRVLRSSLSPDSFSYYFEPIFRVAENIHNTFRKVTAAEAYDCHRNSAKAEAIAEKLILDWKFAKHLVEWHGGKFAAFLQPVISLSNTRRDHFSTPAIFDQQYRTIYPLIRSKLARGDGLHDIVSILDVDEYLYIDFCHLSPNGNRRVAEKIAEIVAPLGFGR
jgi:lysophospholipase L1-like esterase